MTTYEQPGTVIAGRYRVEVTLGRGGMAIVYRVRDEQADKQIALKRCFATDRSKLGRYGALLEREYHTLSQLAHPHIIEVYDYGVDARGPFYTMELLAASDLEKSQRTPWQTTCVALRDVASALAILHSRGLLHRDISLRNVHATPDGRTKLIDFGAMMTMGVSKDVVGTPPFMAPEVLQLQALDARSDLFALGALGYRLLTGRHAFPARRLAELRDVWRSRPAAPHLLVPEVPPELSALILRMLTLDRAGRPQSAAEIIERLRVVANLDREDVDEISRAYLTTPNLVGRETALLAVRRQMLSLVRGDGGVLLVTGAPGSGRSRVLDACALEGKLLGATVVRADLRDASAGEWGVASALGNQLIKQFPKQAAEAARLSRHVLSHVLEDLRTEEPQTVTGYAPERSLIIRELRDWVVLLSKAQRLLLVVDDVERIDVSSLAWLSALAHQAQKNAITLALSIAEGGEQDSAPALHLVRELAQTIELSELQEPQTESLIRSVFGDVANLPLCATRIHGLSHGNPRAAMALAQHLVDSRRARYEAGSWVLPHDLEENDLPRTLADSLKARLGELSGAARELADVLALADEDAPLMANYARLTADRDVKHVFQALDELVSARILTAGAERYHFAQRGFLAVLQDTMPEERRRQLHGRIARLLGSVGGDVLRRAHHLLASGADLAAIELLNSIDLGSQVPPVSLLTAAIARAEQLKVPASTLHRLHMGVLIAAPFSMDRASVRQVAPSMLARLDRESGLAHYRRLEHLPAGERLAAALAQAQREYLDTPERDRVHSAFDAIRELARMYGAILAMASSAFDLELLESLPSLEPLFPLSPTLGIVMQLVEGGKEWLRGRTMVSRDIYEAILTRIAEPDRGGLDDAQYQRVYLGLNHTLGCLEACLGIEAAEQRAALLEKHRTLRVNAWRIRSLLQLAVGNLVEAGKCSRRAELLHAQEGLKERYANAATGMELVMRWRLGDLLGVKGLLPTLSALASQHPGWRPVEFLGQSQYRALQGDLQSALHLALTGLEIAPPLRNPFFTFLAGAHVSLLTELCRVDEAMECAKRYSKLCADEQLATLELGWRAALAFALGGDCEEAVRVLTPHIEQAEQLGRAGLSAGTLYEARARIAIAANDLATFELFAQRCAVEYRKSNNPTLNMQLTRLLELAHTCGVPSAETLTAMHHSLEPPAPESEYETLRSRMAECVDRDDRGRCALTLLLQATASNRGYLFGCENDRTLTLLAALPDAPSDPGLEQWVTSYALKWLAPEDALRGNDSGDMEATTAIESEVNMTDAESSAETETSTGDLLPAQDSLHAYTDRDGHYFEALRLVQAMDCLSAMLVVETVPNQPMYLARDLTERLARELVDHSDVSGWRKP